MAPADHTRHRASRRPISPAWLARQEELAASARLLSTVEAVYDEEVEDDAGEVKAEEKGPHRVDVNQEVKAEEAEEADPHWVDVKQEDIKKEEQR